MKDQEEMSTGPGRERDTFEHFSDGLSRTWSEADQVRETEINLTQQTQDHRLQ